MTICHGHVISSTNQGAATRGAVESRSFRQSRVSFNPGIERVGTTPEKAANAPRKLGFTPRNPPERPPHAPTEIHSEHQRKRWNNFGGFWPIFSESHFSPKCIFRYLSLDHQSFLTCFLNHFRTIRFPNLVQLSEDTTQKQAIFN